MKTLFEQYKSLKESYYKIEICPETLFIPNSGQYSCYNFINEHFILGAKKKVFTIPESYLGNYKENGKHLHTVSLYLMGLLAREAFCHPIRKAMGKKFNIDKWQRYEYTWYLTCLYHDVTSVIERDENHADKINAVTTSDLFCDRFKPLRFSKDTYLDYLRYRHSTGAADHGIVAGTKLFDSLSASFHEATANHNWENEPVSRKGNLVWRKEHLDHFAYIADAVCCHNIWLVPESDKSAREKYQEYGLGSLIVRNESQKLSLQDYPLQYLLCLLDTIEPVKRFSNLSPDVVLGNIFFELHNNQITIGWNDSIKAQPQFFKWLDSIHTLGEWMQIDVRVCHQQDNICNVSLSWRRSNHS